MLSIMAEPLFLLSFATVLVIMLAIVLLASHRSFSYAVLYDGLFEVASEADGGEWPEKEQVADGRVRVVAVELRNSSGRNIERAHYARPITVGFGEGARILDAEVLEEDPPDIGVTLRGVPERDPERVVLEPVLLNDGDAVVLEMVVADTITGDIEVDGRMVGIREIVNRGRSNLEKVLLGVGAGVLFAAATLAGSAGLLSFVSRMFGVDLLGPRILSIAGGVVTGSVVIAILLLFAMVRRWRRASRIESLVRSRYFTAEKDQ